MKIRRRTAAKKDESNNSSNNEADEAVEEEQGHSGCCCCIGHEASDEIPARRVPHKFFLLVSLLVILCALWMAVGQILGIVVYENSLVQYVLRGYVIVLSVLVILIEIEWPQSIRETTMFHYWIPRGLVYLFVGVIGVQESQASQIPKNQEENEMYETMTDIIVAVAWNMAGCGVLYFAMGVLCLQFFLDDLREDYQARLAMANARLHNLHKISGDEEEDVEAVHHQDAAIEAAQSAFAEGAPGVDWAEEGVPQYPEGNDGRSEAAPTWVQDVPENDQETNPGAGNRFREEISSDIARGANLNKIQQGSLDAAARNSRGLPDPASTEQDASGPLAENASKGSDENASVVKEIDSTKGTGDGVASPTDVEVDLRGSESSGGKN